MQRLWQRMNEIRFSPILRIYIIKVKASGYFPGAYFYILEEFRYDHTYSYLLTLRLYRG